MAQAKGTAIVSTLRFVRERFGEEGAAKLVAELSPTERRAVDSGVLASAWYPYSLLLHLTQLAERHFESRLPHVVREIGRASADYGLTTVYKVFFRVGSPQFIISRASALWGNYYDSGEMRAVVSEKGHAVIELKGFAEPAPEFCERVLGWMTRTLELSGSKEVRAVHDACVNRGDAVCRFEGWWK